MDLDNTDLATFDNPAPAEKKFNSGFNAGETIYARRVSKRRLRYRPDVEVTGRRYKGRRVSRADVDLDTRTIGLFNDHDDLRAFDYKSVSHADENVKSEDESGSVVSSEADDDITDQEVDMGDDSHGANGLKIPGLPNDGSSGLNGNGLPVGHDFDARNITQLNDEQRAIMDRLNLAKKDDEDRASAVRFQKNLYDAAVNLRIRLEPLMNLARSFPNQGQREGASSWEFSGTLKGAQQDAENALTALIDSLDLVWHESWPSTEINDKGSNFQQWCDSVLDLWGRKVSDASGVTPKGGFKAFDNSVTAQIRAALSTGKNLNRTKQVKHPILLVGGPELPVGDHELQFDDSEFYRTLLRDIIESGDAPGGALRYAQLAREGRTKKKLDLSLAKGKRIDYKVHEKMVGFLPPIPLPDPGPLDEILTNLLGKGAHVVGSS